MLIQFWMHKECSIQNRNRKKLVSILFFSTFFFFFPIWCSFTCALVGNINERKSISIYLSVCRIYYYIQIYFVIFRNAILLQITQKIIIFLLNDFIFVISCFFFILFRIEIIVNDVIVERRLVYNLFYNL